MAATELVHLAVGTNMTVCTAESCTAGMIASAIADVPGASSVLRGGAITYCDDIKHGVLGVSSRTLATHTAVSDACAQEMALCARKLFGADIAVSATGYAGPGGGTQLDPAGTVYIACCGPRGIVSKRLSLEGSRNVVRKGATYEALQLMVQALDSMGSL